MWCGPLARRFSRRNRLWIVITIAIVKASTANVWRSPAVTASNRNARRPRALAPVRHVPHPASRQKIWLSRVQQIMPQGPPTAGYPGAPYQRPADPYQRSVHHRIQPMDERHQCRTIRTRMCEQMKWQPRLN